MKQINCLEDLAEMMRNASVEEWSDAGLPIRHGEPDWTSLPTFGGEEPANTDEVWSWDADRMIVGQGRADLTIIER